MVLTTQPLLVLRLRVGWSYTPSPLYACTVKSWHGDSNSKTPTFLQKLQIQKTGYFFKSHSLSELLKYSILIALLYFRFNMRYWIRLQGIYLKYGRARAHTHTQTLQSAKCLCDPFPILCFMIDTCSVFPCHSLRVSNPLREPTSIQRGKVEASFSQCNEGAR